MYIKSWQRSMSRRAKAILTYALLALYAGTMLVGQGLHLLTCDHDALIDPVCQHAVSSAVHGVLPPRISLSANNAHDEHHSDCMICQFYSLGHIAPPAVGLSVRPLAVAEMASASHGFTPFHRIVAYSPRGPPSG